MNSRTIRLIALMLFGIALVIPARTPSVTAVQYPCSLQGVEQAITDGGDATFDCLAPSTVTLTTMSVPTKSFSLDGGGRLTLQGQGAPGFAISGITVTLRNLTVQGFPLFADIGAGSVLIADGVLFQNNVPAITTGGSAFHSTGDLIVRNSTFANNVRFGNGGAISVEAPGSLDISNSTFINNGAFSGGAIATSATTRIEGSTFLSNTAQAYLVAPGQNVKASGGALTIGGGQITIQRSRFENNVASAIGGAGLDGLGGFPAGTAEASGGALFVAPLALSALTMTASSVMSNTAIARGSTGPSGGQATARGGGLSDGGGLLSLVVDSTTFAGNLADALGSMHQPSTSTGAIGDAAGGAIFTRSNQVEIRNSTIASNVATGKTGALDTLNYYGNVRGGGIALDSYGRISFSTIASNTISKNGTIGAIDGAGLWSPFSLSTQTFLSSTILAGNTGLGLAQPVLNCARMSQIWIISTGANLSDDESCNLTASGDAQNVPAIGLGPLQNNGGPTLTMAPLPGSPAINTAGVSCSTAIDQRGVPRPRGSQCDKGAVEVGGPVLTWLAPSSGSAGGGAFQLQVSGLGFVTNTVGLWNGITRTTSVLSPTLIRLDIPAGDLAATGTATITARNGGDATTTSNALTFLITAGATPTPTPTAPVPCLSCSPTPTPTVPCPGCTPTAAYRIHLPIVSDAIAGGW